MKGFNFEKNLAHQSKAVESTMGVFEHLEIIKPSGLDSECINPQVNYAAGSLQYYKNIKGIQGKNNIEQKIKPDSNIIDIMMETGTGKTYTYTKTIFELNKHFGIFKYIVLVPTLSIKAGTINFLKSESARQHFKEQYGKTLQLHVVESKKGGKSKKSFMPPAVKSFVSTGTFEKNKIQVLVINAGMINSDTMQKSFDRTLFDKYAVPFEAIAAVKPFLIIDEPHKFGTGKKTWQNIEKMRAQFILRYGATFPEKEIKRKNAYGKLEKIKEKDYQNLIYTLTAVDSFNQNLVKGVIGHITEFESGKNSIVKLTNTNGTEASFELNENNKKKTFKLAKKESLEKVHGAMSDLFIENLNKTAVVLSNGLVLKKGSTINPYSYAETLQDIMIQKAIKSHFVLEKEYLTREVKIKPLTLFFIDNIEEYRGEQGSIKLSVERYIKAEVEALLTSEKEGFYKAYLEKTLEDISKTHGGYFSKDNSEKDEAIEKEINEILHDKQAMLDLENPRRFIFSKWTLREGWDNPNVFQICKLRSSGSDISKLQEVGRGLRLPVNEYNNRVKEEQFYLNYFVDFTESNFVDELVKEINDKSNAISLEEVPDKLNEKIIKKICETYNTTEADLLNSLDANNIIDRTNNFKENGFEYIKQNYPLIFEGIDSNKVRKASDTKKKVSIRVERYAELKELWEKLNEKVVLEYKFEQEDKFKKIVLEFLKEQKHNFSIDGVRNRKAQIDIEGNKAVVNDEVSILDHKITQVSTMKYDVFLLDLAKSLCINLKTLHQCFIDSDILINDYLNSSTIRVIKQKFNNYLMSKAFSKFEIGYQSVSSSIHPTKITKDNGEVMETIDASNVGVFSSGEKVASNYLFNELFYDSELEKENIETEIKEVVIFSKIPKNSIKIPVAGGKSYSPDFAYVLKLENGKKKLNFIVETKNAQEESLREEEKQKIKHAELFFGGAVKITFKTQFSNKKIAKLIGEINAE